jgi:hypothetical protein
VQGRETDQVPTTEIRLAVVWNRHMVFPPSQRTLEYIFISVGFIAGVNY